MYNTFPLSLSMTEEALKALDRLSEAKGQNRSALVRELIERECASFFDQGADSCMHDRDNGQEPQP